MGVRPRCRGGGDRGALACRLASSCSTRHISPPLIHSSTMPLIFALCSKLLVIWNWPPTPSVKMLAKLALLHFISSVVSTVKIPTSFTMCGWHNVARSLASRSIRVVRASFLPKNSFAATTTSFLRANGASGRAAGVHRARTTLEFELPTKMSASATRSCGRSTRPESSNSFSPPSSATQRSCFKRPRAARRRVAGVAAVEKSSVIRGHVLD